MDELEPMPSAAVSATKRSTFLGPLAVIAAMTLAGCSQVELYSNLPEQEANEMMAVLIDNGIACTKKSGEEGTWNLLVGGDQFAASVTKLKELGYPRETFVGMGEVFQKSGLVSSPGEERIRFMHALSQELSRTVSQIDGVVSARVHIVLPENNPFGEKAQPSSAAVFIKYRQGAQLETLTPAIKELVISSIEGMTADKVSVSLFEADPPRPPAVEGSQDKLVDVLGMRVWQGSAKKLWTVLGVSGGAAIIGILLALWMALRGSPAPAAGARAP